MTIYRGFNIEQAGDEFVWTDEAGEKHIHSTEERAMDAIDQHKRRQRANPS